MVGMTWRTIFASLFSSATVLALIASGCGQDFSAAPDGQGGSAQACSTAADCPGLDGECGERECGSNGRCGMKAQPSGAACEQTRVCDGQGSCVECIDDLFCTGGDICLEHVCVPATCGDGTLNGDETAVDCGGSCPGCENGEVCNEGGDCQSGFCGNNGTCAPCAGNDQCPESAFCQAGVCVPKKPTGDTCSNGAMCQSGYCPDQDGVCCESACTETCMGCVQGKTGKPNGTCALLPEGSDFDGECPASEHSTCGSNGSGCNGGAPSCNLYPAGTSCGTAACSSGNALSYECDGAGTCQTNQEGCGLYACDGGACNTTCTIQADCTQLCNTQSGQCVGCGTQVPGGNTCDPICTGGCNNGSCTINCTGADSCSNQTIDCPPGVACQLKCEGDNACEGTVLNCNALYACGATCTSASVDVCRNLTINCGIAGTCSLTCGGGSQACADASVICGRNACSATCASAVDPPTLTCGEACGCTHNTCY